ncbi:MAG: helix-turn-helix domain-containing protein [Bifidobacterium pseudolongum]|nr:helix-turn-helix domain-containing protein [Bifidobacterium pseudolongum]
MSATSTSDCWCPRWTMPTWSSSWTMSSGEIDDARIRAHQRTFDAYTRFNGSITHAAEALHIHKNTMQNHLNGIADDTGYNPRTLQDYSVLDTAFRLYDYLRFTHAYDKAPEA